MVVLWRISMGAGEMQAVKTIDWSEDVTLEQRTQDRSAVDVESLCVYVAKWSRGLET